MGSWTVATIAFLVLAYAAAARRFEQSLVTSAIFFTTTGLIAGPGLGLIELPAGGGQIRLLAQATLTLVLFADASRISLRALRTEYALPLRLLGIGLPLTIVAGALAGALLFPSMSWAEALVLAVSLACTDAALGKAVVTDARLPSLIRQGLNVESGLNDGICVPIFFIALGLAEVDASTVSSHSAFHLVVDEIGYGSLAGLLAGAGAALVERYAVKHGWTETAWIQVYTFAAAVFASGLALGLDGSTFIAAFVGGLVFGTLRRQSGGEVAHFLEQSGELLNAVTFTVFGAAIVWPALHHVDWQVVLYALLSLTVVRMLPVAIAMLGTHAGRQTVAFLGWSGPRGLASIVFAVLVTSEANLPHEQDILVAITFTVLLSVFAHGLSAGPLTERYVRWYSSRAERPPSPMEIRPAAPHRVRWPARAQHPGGSATG